MVDSVEDYMASFKNATEVLEEGLRERGWLHKNDLHTVGYINLITGEFVTKAPKLPPWDDWEPVYRTVYSTT